MPYQSEAHRGGRGTQKSRAEAAKIAAEEAAAAEAAAAAQAAKEAQDVTDQKSAEEKAAAEAAATAEAQKLAEEQAAAAKAAEEKEAEEQKQAAEEQAATAAAASAIPAASGSNLSAPSTPHGATANDSLARLIPLHGGSTSRSGSSSCAVRSPPRRASSAAQWGHPSHGSLLAAF